MASNNKNYNEANPSLTDLQNEKQALERQLAEELRALAAANAEKERCEKIVAQTKIDLLALEKETRDKRESQGK